MGIDALSPSVAFFIAADMAIHNVTLAPVFSRHPLSENLFVYKAVV